MPKPTRTLSWKTWEANRLARLKEFWAAGLSGSQIAAELGSDVTRSAVLSKVWKLGLTRKIASPADLARFSAPKERFGSLVVWTKVRKGLWMCRCDCGNYKIVRAIDLHRGHIKTCGCGRLKPRNDLSGLRFGALTVTGGSIQSYGRGQRMWETQCDCGAKLIVPAKSLRSGNTKSCGCLRQAQSRINAEYTNRAYDGRFIGTDARPPSTDLP